MSTINNTAITVRTNKDVKDQAQSLFSTLGLDLSTAINIFLRQSVREKRIPFIISCDEPSETTYKILEESENEKNFVGPFNTVGEALESLNA